MTVRTMTPELREALRQGWESERENWGQDEVDTYLRAMERCADGERLTPLMELGAGYFGLMHLAGVAQWP